MRAFRLDAIDLLFFRDGTPFNAGESGFLPSRFPPTPVSAYGFARAVLVESQCHNVVLYVNRGCSECDRRDSCAVSGVVGDPSKRDGTLSIRGPYLAAGGSRYYKMPLDICSSQDSEPTQMFPGGVSDDVVETDLGQMRFPHPGPGRHFYRDAGLLVVEESGLLSYLRGESVDLGKVRSLAPLGEPFECLCDMESRVGISIDSSKGRARDHHLYQIEMVRPRPGTSINITLEEGGSQVNDGDSLIMRFGGEGRVVHVSVVDQPPFAVPPVAEIISKHHRFRLVLLQDANFQGSWIPPGLTRPQDETSAFSGTLNGVKVKLVSATIGRAARAGGWDTSRNRPRDLVPLVPAGSVYYFESEESSGDEIMKAFHDRKVGVETHLGFGHCVVGVW